jgi:hypothetical protein
VRLTVEEPTENTSTWLAGRHTFKAGLDLQYVEYVDQISFFDGEELGRYVFDGTFTGHAFAEFMLGLPHFTGYILPAPEVNPFATYYAFFAQDSWRPSRAITIDVGLRYDLRPPMNDRSNQLGNFDTGFPGGRVIVSDEAGLALVPSFVRQSAPNTPFVTAEEAGLPATLRRTDRNNVSPRIGIAWRPTEDGRTVIRGGVGLYTVPLLGSVDYSMVATVTAAAVNFANTLSSPFVFPNISSAASAEGALPPGTLDFRRATQIDMRDPRTAQWSVTVEQDFGWNTAARVSYVGSTTTDLIWSPDLNQVHSNTLGYDAVRNTRPFLDWNVVTTRANDPRSRYDALGMALTKRISDGLTFDASYTLAKHQSDPSATPTRLAPARRPAGSRPRSARTRSATAISTNGRLITISIERFLSCRPTTLADSAMPRSALSSGLAQVFSMTLGKSFATGGTSHVRFEMAFANLFNLENLDIPNTNVTSSAFGRVTNTQTVDQAGPRTIQVSLRYSF